MSSRSANRLVGATLLLSSLALYLVTMGPDLTWGDSGEFVADTSTLGIPHPTGYPFYVLLGRVFLLIPVGSPAYRMNLLSGVSSALAVTVLYFALLEAMKNPMRRQEAEPAGDPNPDKIAQETKSPAAAPGTATPGTATPDTPAPGAATTGTAIAAAAIAAFSFAVTQSFWSQATKAEVYALASLFAALFLLISFRLNRTGDRSLLYLWFLVLGLLLTHHRILVLLVPLGAWLILPTLRTNAGRTRLSRTRHPGSSISRSGTNTGRIRLSRILFAFLAGLSPLLYLYLRGKADPVMNWGAVHSIGGVIRTLRGGDYGEALVGPLEVLRRSGGSPAALVGFFRYWVVFAVSQYGYIAALALPGVLLWKGRGVVFRLFLAATLLVALLLPVFYQVGDKQEFFYLFVVLLPLPIAEGIRMVLRLVQTTAPRPAWWGLALVFLLHPLVTAADNWSTVDRSRDRSAAAFARETMDTARGASMIVTGIDRNVNSRDNETFALWYQKYARMGGKAPPIVCANFIGFEWYRSRLEKQGLSLPNWNRYVESGQAAETRDGVILFRSREDWIAALAKDVLIPALEKGPVYSTGESPGPWGGIRFVEAKRVPIDLESIYPPERPFIPSGIIYRLEPPPGLVKPAEN